VNKTLSSAFHRSAIRGSKALLLSAAGPAALACAAPALADEGAAAPVAATATAETPVGEPILVTARRRDENVQKVPIAISVIGSKLWPKRAITRCPKSSSSCPVFRFTASIRATPTSTFAGWAPMSR
jgi:iron complex outermembrane receptor protein